MALDLKLNTNVKNVQARYVKFIHRFPPIITKGMKQAGEQLKTIIVKRTELGKDAKGNKFIGYSPAYAELKGKTIVDLEDTNRMLQSISSRVVGKNKAQIFFRSQREATKALFHQKGMGNLPIRKFFGYSKKTEKVIQNTFAKFVKREIRKLGL
tara:strand:- start:215 stop:676 length:462 start_codon:yes stop_codon:yes gene_type:complete